MASENETFDEVLRCMQNDIVHFVGKPVKHSRDLLQEYHDRFKAAHQREVSELKSKMNDVVCENEALRDACGTCGAKREREATREKSSRVGNAAKRKNEVTDRNIYIVYNGVRYRLVEGRDCTNHCSFRKADGPYYCERGCYLPSWFKRLCIGGNYWLERVDPKVELLKKVKGVAK